MQFFSVGKLAVAIWGEAASIETPGIILNTYHDYVQLYVKNCARIPAHVEPCIELLQVQ